MGFFTRLGNIISGKANKALDSIEKPMEQFENDLRKKTEEVKEAKKQVASFYAEIDVQEGKLKALKAERDQYKKGAIAAAQKGLKDQFAKWKGEENRLDILITEQENIVQNMYNQGEDLKTRVKNAEKYIIDARREKDLLKARSATAKVTSKINESIMNLDKDSNFSLDTIRESIEKQEGYAKGLDNLKDNSKEELNELISSVNDIDMDAEMEKYKNMEV